MYDSEKISVVLVINNQDLKYGLDTYITSCFPDVRIEKAYTSTEQLYIELAQLQSNLFLIDYEFSNQTCMDIAKSIMQINFFAQFIALTAYDDEIYLETLIIAGFKACVLKNRIIEDLPIALESIKQRKFFFPQKIKFNKPLF